MFAWFDVLIFLFVRYIFVNMVFNIFWLVILPF